MADISKHDVIRKLGFPNEIDSETKIRSVDWRCDRCRRRFHFDRPVRIPAPCAKCGGIVFTAME